jgi:hypothetical protein
VDERRPIDIYGAVHAAVQPDATYAVRAGGNIRAIAEVGQVIVDRVIEAVGEDFAIVSLQPSDLRLLDRCPPYSTSTI